MSESKYSLGEAAQKQIAAMLRIVATEVRPCKACGRVLYMLPTKNGKTAPYTDDAVNHFADCPKAHTFKTVRA